VGFTFSLEIKQNIVNNYENNTNVVKVMMVNDIIDVGEVVNNIINVGEVQLKTMGMLFKNCWKTTES